MHMGPPSFLALGWHEEGKPPRKVGAAAWGAQRRASPWSDDPRCTAETRRTHAPALTLLHTARIAEGRRAHRATSAGGAAAVGLA